MTGHEWGAERGALVCTTELVPGTELTIPVAGSSGLQDRLAAANAAARAMAVARLGQWFPGYDFEAAAQNVDARTLCVVDLGDALLRHLDGEAMMDTLLFRHDHTWGPTGVSFSHGDLRGHQPPPSCALTPGRSAGGGRLDPGGLAGALDRRWTAIVNGADTKAPALSEVCGDLTKAYGSSINTNIYLSYGPSKGFGAHWDNHDAIIVPLMGAKRSKCSGARRGWHPRIAVEEAGEGVNGWDALLAGGG